MNAPNPANSFAQRPNRLVQLIAPACAVFLALEAGGCRQGNPAPITSGAAPNTIVAQPDPTIGSQTFVVDENQGGQASSVRIRSVMWGRLVDVRDLTGVTQNQGMVIGEDIHSDNFDYLLETNAITEATSVTILHDANTPAYIDAFRRLDQNLIVALDKSLNPSTLPPFTLVPRNSAMVIKFDDLIDSTSIGRETLRLVTGYPAVTPFDYRSIPDINHGDLFDADGDGVLEFHTTRVILDLTVSAIEAGQTSPPPPINNLGLPASLNTSQANVGVRIPTHRDASIGQTTLLTNLAGHALSFTNNGSTDPAVSTDDVVRAVRSGGNTAVTADPHNGFLLDEISPKIVGVQPVQISTPIQVGNYFQTTVDYTLDFCASRLKLGDVIQQPGVFAEVILASSNPVGGTVSDVQFRIVYPLGGTLGPGSAQIFTVWDPVVNFGKQGCFVRYAPSNAAGGTTPGQGVSSDAQVLLRFSEPMDPSTVSAFDNMPILRVDPGVGAPTARDYVIGSVQPSADLKEFKFKPVRNFKHTLGSANDRYWINVGSGATGPTDLSGRPITDALPAVLFSIDPNDSTEVNGGLVFRFSSQDELGADGKPEWRGQTAPDLTSGTLSPRPLDHRARRDGAHPDRHPDPALGPGQQAAGALALLRPGPGSDRRERLQRRRRAPLLVTCGGQRGRRLVRPVRDPSFAHEGPARRVLRPDRERGDLPRLRPDRRVRQQPARQHQRCPGHRAPAGPRLRDRPRGEEVLGHGRIDGHALSAQPDHSGRAVQVLHLARHHAAGQGRGRRVDARGRAAHCRGVDRRGNRRLPVHELPG